MPNYVKQYTRKSQAERREEIIDAALLILGEHGVDGMTMARIAEAVGITPGALYRHFGSRDAILAAAVEVAIERAMSWVETADAPDALERLGELGRNLAPWQRQNLNTMARPIFQTLASLKEPEFARQMNPLNWPSLERMVRDRRRRQASGNHPLRRRDHRCGLGTRHVQLHHRHGAAFAGGTRSRGGARSQSRSSTRHVSRGQARAGRGHRRVTRAGQQPSASPHGCERG